MKKHLKNEGKIALLIILSALVISTGIIFLSTKEVNASVTVAAYDGGGDGGGGGTGGGGGSGTFNPPPMGTPTPPTELPNPSTWPRPGVTESLLVCKNGAKALFRGECDGSTYRLLRVTAAHEETKCEEREVKTCGNGATMPAASVILADNKYSKKFSLADEDNCVTRIEQYNCVTTWVPEVTTFVSSITNHPLCYVSCKSAPNACGEVQEGILANGVCTAVTPAVSVAGYGQACQSSGNACGQKNTGTIGCNGLCNATVPANPLGYGNTCSSPANSCGDTVFGTKLCDGTCSAKNAPAVTDPSCGSCGGKTPPANYGQACESAPNVCLMTNKGTISCDGSCNAVTPAETMCQACTLTWFCGKTTSGYIVDGKCNAKTLAKPQTLGDSCTASNSCGMTNSGTIGCDFKCSATAPSEDLCPAPCNSAPNACGQTTTGMTAGGICQAVTPPNPDVYVKTGKCSPPVCTINQKLNPTTYVCEQIVCPIGKTLSNGLCLDIVCAANQILEGNTCKDVVCQPTEQLVGNVCVPKPLPIVDGLCSTTVVDTCMAGSWKDTTDTGTQYLWSCMGANGGKDASCAINKAVVKQPVVDITPVSASITEGQTTTFSWNVKDATECKLYKSGSYLKDIPLVSSYTSAALSANATFDVRCANVQGEMPYPSTTGTHTVNVSAIPPKAAKLRVSRYPTSGYRVAFGEVQPIYFEIVNEGDLPLTGNITLKDDRNGTYKFYDGGLSTSFTLGKNIPQLYKLSYTPKRIESSQKIIRKSLLRNLAATGYVEITDMVIIAITSNGGNENITVHETGVDAVSGPTNLGVGEVPAGISKVVKYPVRNNTLVPLTACLKLNGASEFKFDGVTSEIDALITAEKENIFNVTFKPTPNVYPKTYTDKVIVGVRQADSSCKQVYSFDVSGEGVKPIGKFDEI